MAERHQWSIAVAAPGRRPRWLSEGGRFSVRAERALRLISPEVAARRLQDYRRLRGWPPEAMERFRLVPAPALQDAPAGMVARCVAS